MCQIFIDPRFVKGLYRSEAFTVTVAFIPYLVVLPLDMILLSRLIMFHSSIASKNVTF